MCQILPCCHILQLCFPVALYTPQSSKSLRRSRHSVAWWVCEQCINRDDVLFLRLSLLPSFLFPPLSSCSPFVFPLLFNLSLSVFYDVRFHLRLLYFLSSVLFTHLSPYFTLISYFFSRLFTSASPSIPPPPSYLALLLFFFLPTLS
jgi:hypothetical protein